MTQSGHWARGWPYHTVALLEAGIGPNPEKTNGGTDADALRFRQFSVLPKSANYDVRQGAHMGIRQGRFV